MWSSLSDIHMRYPPTTDSMKTHKQEGRKGQGHKLSDDLLIWDKNSLDEGGGGAVRPSSSLAADRAHTWHGHGELFPHGGGGGGTHGVGGGDGGGALGPGQRGDGRRARWVHRRAERTSLRTRRTESEWGKF